MAQKPRVAIIGRANVGKSTLFNRLTSTHASLVSPVAGTTRDRQERDVAWSGRYLTLIDTGGLDIETKNPLEQQVAKQALKALQDADLILFVVDVKRGITAIDQSIAQLLRKTKKQLLLVANKVDSNKDLHGVTEWYRLGLGNPLPVSAATGSGTGDLLDEVLRKIKTSAKQEEVGIRIALVGKPNVGKSSLANAMLGEDRTIVFDEPYTTRDATEIPFTFEGQKMLLVDTAGVRRKSKIDPSTIEKESVYQSLENIRKADVVLLVLEANEQVTAQDRQLAQLIHDSHSSVVIIGNKWDLVTEKTPEITNRFEEYYHKHLNFLWWAPVILMSAKEQTKLTKLRQTIVAAHREQLRTIEKPALAKLMKGIIKTQKPPIGKGSRQPYIYELKQVGTKPPQFVIEIGEDTSLKSSYLNFIERRLRDTFGFTGAPIKLWIEKRQKTRQSS